MNFFARSGAGGYTVHMTNEAMEFVSSQKDSSFKAKSGLTFKRTDSCCWAYEPETKSLYFSFTGSTQQVRK